MTNPKVLYEWPGETETVRYGTDAKGYLCVSSNYSRQKGREWFHATPRQMSTERRELAKLATENGRKGDRIKVLERALGESPCHCVEGIKCVRCTALI